jgi:zinc finger protein 830
MADVRSLLRSELSSRRIKHPHVSYSKGGLALCNICNLTLRSDSFWEPHQRSKDHKANLQKLQEGGETNIGPVSKKRKVGSADLEDEARKKIKSGMQTPSTGVDIRKEGPAQPTSVIHTTASADLEDQQTSTGSDEVEPLREPTLTAIHPDPPEGTQPPPPAPPGTVDEDEWAAFEREVVIPTHQPASAILNSTAAITAAPVSAAELAAAEESGEQKKTRREEEIEGEKEDAVRRLEDEFDQMEELEERVRKMRERREGIRSRSTVEDGKGEVITASPVVVQETTVENEEENAIENKEEDMDDDDEDEDEWGWALR